MSDNNTNLPTQIYTKLTDFGLEEIEAKIYVFLTNREPQSVVEIAKALNQPRTSVYDHLEILVDRGLVEQLVKYKSRQFRAYPLEILNTMIDQEKSRIEKLASSLTFLKQNITKISDIHTPATQVRYFHGPEGLRQMMWNALSAEKEIIGYSLMERKEIVGEKFLKRFLEEFANRHLIDRVIINQIKSTLKYISDGNLSIDGKLANFERIREIDDKTLKITGDTTIYNNVFAVMYWLSGEVVGVEIENPELVKMQKSMFEILWKTAKPLK
jgi:sugar-specific transcriptional regulator TrmB